MSQSSSKTFSSYSDQYDVNIRMITFSASIIVLTLVAIFFIKTYVSQKQDIIDTMYVEGEMMETFCSENINHVWYVIHLLASQISKNPHEKPYIKNIFKDYIGDSKVMNIFSWTEFIWIDHKTHEIVSVKNPQNPMSDHNRMVELTKIASFEKIAYWVDYNKEIIYTILAIPEPQAKEVAGFVVVSFDLRNVVRRLNTNKKHQYTNVAVIDWNRQVLVQSTESLKSIGINDGTITNRDLQDALNYINFARDDGNESFSYLDLLSGKNFYLQKVKDIPFVILINIDEKEIRNDMLYSVVTKFIEISLVASCFLLLVLFVYKREVWLRKQAEIASEIANRATNAKSDFLAFTAHEIRSPLGFIITGSEVMLKELLGPLSLGYKEYISGIHKNAQLILKFITDILDESHIMAGTFKVVARPVDSRDIINNALSINEEKRSQKNITILVDIAPDVPLLMCDSTRMLQVMNNLLSNAIRYSPDYSQVKIIVTLESKKVCIEILDQGVGMTEEELSVAFEKYGTVRNENFNFMESYGLGLPIVKMILDAHSATLVVNTIVNTGTSFKIVFPESATVTSEDV